MTYVRFFTREVRTTQCTIEIEHSADNLYAHVELDEEGELHPGDSVTVHGAPIHVEFGQRLVLRRAATIERASWIERAWARLIARLELNELYEVSFTPGRL